MSWSLIAFGALVIILASRLVLFAGEALAKDTDTEKRHGSP